MTAKKIVLSQEDIQDLASLIAYCNDASEFDSLKDLAINNDGVNPDIVEKWQDWKDVPEPVRLENASVFAAANRLNDAIGPQLQE